MGLPRVEKLRRIYTLQDFVSVRLVNENLCERWGYWRGYDDRTLSLSLYRFKLLFSLIYRSQPGIPPALNQFCYSVDRYQPVS